MGLDSWLFAIDSKCVSDSGVRITADSTNEIKYWRNHHSLHRWMENLYRKCGGDGEFNLIALFLSKDDLDRLEQDIINDKLQYTAGFFSSTEEAKKYDLEAVKSAKECLALGYLVYYNSWW